MNENSNDDENTENNNNLCSRKIRTRKEYNFRKKSSIRTIKRKNEELILYM